MNCPVCKNEEIKEGQDFCSACGLDLRKKPEALTEEAINENRITDEILKEVAELRKNTMRLKEKGAVISVEIDGAHLSEQVFRCTFSNYQVAPRNSDYCPVELSAIYDGVKFFAISDRP